MPLQSESQAPVLLSAPPDIRGLKVLLVEDNDIAGQLIKEMLHSLGFNIALVSSGHQALQELEQALNDNPFKLVITDWKMPDMDGLELTKRIRNHSALQKHVRMPKIIVVTMYDWDELMQNNQGKALFDGYLLKPINSSEMLNVIMQCFGKENTMVARFSPSIDTSLPRLEQLAGVKVLLVEDNYINQEVAVAILKEAGMYVKTAADGKKAVDMLIADADREGGGYEVILMDVQMPVWDGYMATQIIRKDSRFSHLPIIAMTAHALKGDKEKCLAAGMNDYISKPIDERELFSILIKWLTAKARPTIPATGQMTNAWDNMPANIPGIDLEAALRRMKGDSSLFRRMLCRFLNTYASADEQLKEQLQQGRIKEAKVLVHTLKGVSGNLCANGLYQVTKRLDELLQQGSSRDRKSVV